MDITYTERHGERALERFIADPMPHKPVLLVEGARQVGKTTLVEHVLAGSAKPTVRINLERDSLDRMAFDECRDFAAFQDLLLDRHGFRPNADQVLFIDEAQESRKLGAFVRFMKEEWPRATVVLSGSTLRRLFRPHTRYPVGRVRRLVLGPFSFSEFLRAVGQGHLADQVLGDDTQFSDQRHDHLLARFDQFLAVGGLPAVVQAYAAGDDHALVRRQIVADYEQDFIRLFGEESVDIATACLRSVANFVGGVSKNTSVVPAPSSRVNARINEVFARLESWHLILRSEQKGSSAHASHAYLPKRYLFDTGVLRELRESAVPTISAVHTMAAARAHAARCGHREPGRDRAGARRTAAGRLETLAGGVRDRLHRQERPGRGPGRVQGEPLGEPSPHARPDCLSALPRPAPRIHRESGAVRGNQRGRCADRESARLSPGAPRTRSAVRSLGGALIRFREFRLDGGDKPHADPVDAMRIGRRLPRPSTHLRSARHRTLAPACVPV